MAIAKKELLVSVVLEVIVAADIDHVEACVCDRRRGLAAVGKDLGA